MAEQLKNRAPARQMGFWSVPDMAEVDQQLQWDQQDQADPRPEPEQMSLFPKDEHAR